MQNNQHLYNWYWLLLLKNTIGYVDLLIEQNSEFCHRPTCLNENMLKLYMSLEAKELFLIQ